jgi:hypothetical protein
VKGRYETPKTVIPAKAGIHSAPLTKKTNLLQQVFQVFRRDGGRDLIRARAVTAGLATPPALE